MAEYVEKEFGGCDVLFNNAGIHLAGRILETPPADFDKIMSIDCRGVYLACYYFMPMMLKKQYGTIINMSSVSGICADYSMAAYNTAKGAVTNLTRAIAIDYADQGIRCNAIALAPSGRRCWSTPLGKSTTPSGSTGKPIPLTPLPRPKKSPKWLCFWRCGRWIS